MHTAHCQAAGGAEEEAEQLLEGPGTSPPYNRSCQVRSGPELAGKPILSYRDKQTCIRAIEDQERSVKDKQEFVKYVIEETGRLICEKNDPEICCLKRFHFLKKQCIEYIEYKLLT